MSGAIRRGCANVWAGFNRILVVVWLRRTVRALLRDQCLLRASALTFSTLLAVVPLLAVMLAVLKGAGFGSHLRPFLLSRFPVLEPAAVEQLLAYIHRANAQAVGGVGLAALLLSAWAMLSNIEETLNHIFGVSRARGYIRRTGEYLAMIIVGAVMVVLSIVLQTVLGSPTLIESLLGDRVAGDATRFTLMVLPWLSIWGGLVFLYSWMPNKQVPLVATLEGAFLGGTLFQLLQVGYIELQLGFGRYHVIYGALAQLPILLIWVYLSWVVVLIGAEATAARATLSVREDPAFALDPAGVTGESLAVLILLQVCEAFRAGAPTPGPDQIATRLGVSVHRVREAALPLQRAGILVEPENDRHGYLPAAALATVSLDDLLLALS